MSNTPYLITIKKAAAMLGLEYRALLRAVDSGAVPYYRVDKSRRLVNFSEVLACIKVKPKE